MKKIHALILGILVLGCQPSGDDQSKKELKCDQINPELDYAIRLDTAEQHIDRFVKTSKVIFDTLSRVLHKEFPSEPIRAFTIRSIDLLEVLGIPKETKTCYDHARVYLGLDEQYNFRLFLTPVDSADLDNGKAGKDIYLNRTKSTNPGDTKANEIIDMYLMDFTKPCPTTCPENDILKK